MSRFAAVLVLFAAGSPAWAQSPYPAEIRPPNPTLFDQAVAAEGEGKAKTAIELYKKAAQAGNAKAAYRLGEIYDKALIGISRDYPEALRWYNAARVLGHPPLIGDFPPHRSR